MRNVTINNSQANVDFNGLRNLTLNGNVGLVPVPPGTYGDFTANGSSGYTLGVAGTSEPAVYRFQHLTLNGTSRLQVVGPVVVEIANTTSLNGDAGSSEHPEWLHLRVSNGDITLNGKIAVYGYILAGSGTITVNGNSQLIGGAAADKLTLNGNGLLRAINARPAVALTSPGNRTIATFPVSAISLSATASDVDGAILMVEFYSGVTKLGEAAAPPYRFNWTNVPPGTYAFTAKATDNAGASTLSAPVTFIVNAPPTVTFATPAPNAILAAPGNLALTATAGDSDGTIAKVEFYQDGAKIGESANAPYRLPISNLPAGTYTFTARAIDNRGAIADSPPRRVVVETPPTAAVAAPLTVARGGAVTLTATTTDADGAIAKVEFYRGTTLLGTVIAPTGIPPVYAFTDGTALAPGRYTYSVRSYDNLGLYADSAGVAVAILATLPYTADFEEQEGYSGGTLNGQLGWDAAPPAGATVVTDIAKNGANSIALAPGTPPVRVAQTFAPLADHTVVFADFFARPIAETDVANSTTFEVEGARFAFAREGARGVLNAFNGDGAGGGSWQATAFSAPIDNDNQVPEWTRLTVRLDFARKTWDLYAGGNMVGADLKLRDNSATFLSSFAIRGDAATATRLDYIFAGADNPLFADLNANGIDDAWEIAHQLSLAANNRDASPTGNGVSVVQAYISGTDPNDFYNGILPQITPLGDAADGLAADGSISVKVTDSAGRPIANAPIVFRPQSGGHRLAATPGGTPVDEITVRTASDGIAKVFVIAGGQ